MQLTVTALFLPLAFAAITRNRDWRMADYGNYGNETGLGTGHYGNQTGWGMGDYNQTGWGTGDYGNQTGWGTFLKKFLRKFLTYMLFL